MDDLLLLVWTLIKVLLIAVPLIVAVAFFTLAERKVIGWMQVRLGRPKSDRWRCCSPSPTPPR